MHISNALLPIASILAFLATGPLVLAAPSVTSRAAPNAQAAQVEFVFKGFSAQSGRLMAQLICTNPDGQQPQTFPAQVEVRGLEVVVRFPNQRAGQVCSMRAFRDENDNQKLDLGNFGIPKEPYAFSNNAQAQFGPPKPEATRFVLQPGQNSQTITIR